MFFQRSLVTHYLSSWAFTWYFYNLFSGKGKASLFSSFQNKIWRIWQCMVGSANISKTINIKFDYYFGISSFTSLFWFHLLIILRAILLTLLAILCCMSPLSFVLHLTSICPRKTINSFLLNIWYLESSVVITSMNFLNFYLLKIS